jgi:phosphate transport system permease protein
MIYGTLATSVIALFMAVPIGLASAIVLSENSLPLSIRNVIVFLVELLAAIPSIVYGFWGIYVLIPFLKIVEQRFHDKFGWIPLFATTPSGPGMLPAGTILAIMVSPFITAISHDSLTSLPNNLRWGAYSVGSNQELE